MNAHNERHDPACIAAYEQLFQADSRDPSQTERLAVWAMSWNAARAAEPSPVVKQNLTTQPAAAQEAAYQVRRGIGEPWKECDRAAFDVVMASRPADARKLYAAPVTAAPAKCPACASATESYCCNCGWASASAPAAPADSLSPLARIADAFGVTGTWDQIADAVIARSTPAAPGIDLDEYDAGVLSDFGGGDIGWWQDYIRAELARAHEFYQSQIDGSPNPVAAPLIDLADVSLAAQMLTWGREEGLTEGQIAEIDAHAQKLFALIEQADASPKGALPALPDDFSESKDWRAGSYAERVEWLMDTVRSQREHIDDLLDSSKGSATEYCIDRAVEAFDDVFDGVSYNKREAIAAALAAGVKDSPKGGSDPWRGLYAPERAPNRDEYGCFYHPDIPSWDDEREESIAPLLKAQGFDLQCVPGDFSDEAMEEGGERYWQEMREWNPEPEGDGWRLVAIYDTEDGPYSMFVKPLAQAGDAEVQP